MPLLLAPLMRQAARAVTEHELVILALLAPLLVFPNGWAGPAFVAACILWLARRVARGSFTRRTALDIPIALLVSMALVGMGVSVDPAVSWPKLWGMLLGVAMFYGIVNAVPSEAGLRVLTGALLLVGTLVAILSLFITDWQSFQYYDLTGLTSRIPALPELAQALPTGGVPRVALTLLHPREVGGAMGMLFPLALATLVFGQGGGLRLLAGVAVASMAFVLVLAQALSALAGVLLAVASLLAWRYPRLRPLLLAGLLATLALGVVGVTALFAPGNKAGDGIIERVVIWLWGLDMLRHMPITGVGLNSFDYVLSGLYPMALITHVYHAHSLLVQVALDVGLPGLAAYLWLLCAFFATAWSGLKGAGGRTTHAIVAGAAAGVLSFLVYGSMDTITLGAKPGAALWALLGMTVAAAPSPIAQRPQNKPHLLRWAILAIGAIGGLSALLILVPSGRGLLYLNLGTAQAHRALVIARSTASPDTELLGQARRNLEQAHALGQQTLHTDELLASIHGWLGDCEQTVAYLRRSIAAGGSQAPGSSLVVSALPGEAALNGRDPAQAAWYASLEELSRRLSLPRTMDMQFNRYRMMLDAIVTRWGPFATWWEPYLRIAIIASEQYHDPGYAQQMLQKGRERAMHKAPLGCYRPEP